jgi:D-alanyl-lipoteichoic acid acyltransferase DltB (MBOAT superfamily)
MLFTQGNYFIFLLAVFFAYWLIAARVQWRRVFLLAASYCFYAQAGWQALLLLFAISTLDFSTTSAMQRSANVRARKLLLAISLTGGLGALCVFKYANFFLSSATQSAALFGWQLSAPYLQLLAPLGLSFFVFQSIAYVLDVYRRATEPARSYVEYLTFIAFFPTLIAGPILRAKQLLPQLRARLTLDAETGGQALFLIALGLLKKIAIADYLSANLVERVFDFPERYSALEVLAGVYGYALQIYCDFSGYSDVAIGSALLLGFALPANFNAPYRAADLPEFWRRWHISLSTWLRDYVFFTVVGSRARQTAALYGGLLVTMLLGGLWHGATWTFVFWGLLHGLGLIAVRVWQASRNRFKALRHLLEQPALGVLLTFHFVCLTWVFFRAETFAQALALLRQLASFSVDTSNLTAPLALLIVCGLLSQWLPDRVWETTRDGFTRLPAPAQALLLFGLSVGLYLVASSDVAPFIYTRF